MENLNINEKGDEEGFCFDLEENGEDNVDFKWCLVGRFLCDRAIHIPSMKKVWRIYGDL